MCMGGIGRGQWRELLLLQLPGSAVTSLVEGEDLLCVMIRPHLRQEGSENSCGDWEAMG